MTEPHPARPLPPVARAPARLLAVAFAALLAGVLIVDQAREVAAGRRGGWGRARTLVQEAARLAEPITDEGNLAERNRRLVTRIGQVETRLVERSILAAHLVPPLRALLVGALGASTEEVDRGRDGWLFLRADVDAVTGPGFLAPEVLAARAREERSGSGLIAPDPRPAITAFASELAARGIALLVVPIPGKATVEPDRLALRPAPGAAPRNPSFAAFAAELAAAGVALYDPLPELLAARAASGEALYLARDSHWTPTGAAVVAQGIAAQLRALGLATAAPTAAGQPTTVAGNGDLVEMMRVPAPSRWFPRQEVAATVPPTQEGAAQILLLGDSFANVFHLDSLGWGTGAGLPELLAAALGQPVTTVAVNGDGAFASRAELAQLREWGDDPLAGSRAVVWTFAERELAVGDWRH